MKEKKRNGAIQSLGLFPSAGSGASTANPLVLERKQEGPVRKACSKRLFRRTDAAAFVNYSELMLTSDKQKRKGLGKKIPKPSLLQQV